MLVDLQHEVVHTTHVCCLSFFPSYFLPIPALPNTTAERYTIDTKKLKDLGWVEEKTWDEGLKETVEWYRQYTSRYPDIEEALKAHPRAGMAK